MYPLMFALVLFLSSQKLTFSDDEGDESTQSRPNKQSEKLDNVPRGQRVSSLAQFEMGDKTLKINIKSTVSH